MKTTGIVLSSPITKYIATGIFVIGMIGVLKIYFNTPYISIIYLIATGLAAGMLGSAFVGFVNPRDWFYRNRTGFLSVGAGVVLGIIMYGKDAIEEGMFETDRFLILLVIMAILGRIIFHPLFKDRNQKEIITSFKQRLMDTARVSFNTSRSNGTLLLTENKLIFIERKAKEVLFEKNIREIHPVINKVPFIGIPNGFKLENEDVVFRVRFPYYWLEKIELLKQKK